MSAQLNDSELVPVPPGLKLKWQAVRLPISDGLQQHGFTGPLVGDASDEDLKKCLAADRRHLFGGTYTDDRDDPGVKHRSVGVLGDLSLNPRGHQDPDAYLADVYNTPENRKSVYRCWRRIRVVEQELESRATERGREERIARDLARKRLGDFLESVPGVAAQYRQRAREAAAAMALLQPIIAALELLQGCYPARNHNLRSAFADLIGATEQAAHALGREPPQVSPLAQLPDGPPTYDEVQRLVSALRGNSSQAKPLPEDGRGNRFDQTLRDAARS
jgi:hypothetical protein